MLWHAIVLMVCSVSSVPQAESTAHTEGMREAARIQAAPTKQSDMWGFVHINTQTLSQRPFYMHNSATFLSSVICQICEETFEGEARNKNNQVGKESHKKYLKLFTAVNSSWQTSLNFNTLIRTCSYTSYNEITGHCGNNNSHFMVETWLFICKWICDALTETCCKQTSRLDPYWHILLIQTVFSNKFSCFYFFYLSISVWYMFLCIQKIMKLKRPSSFSLPQTHCFLNTSSAVMPLIPLHIRIFNAWQLVWQ